MGSLGRDEAACSRCIPKGWSWERSSSAHLPWATVQTPQSRDGAARPAGAGTAITLVGGSSCCALRGCWSRPFTCLGVPWTCWENWLLLLQQGGSNMFSKLSVKRGKLSHDVQCRQQVSVWVPEPLSSPPAHVTSSHAGKGKLIRRYFTWAGLLSLAGNMLAQTPQSAAGVPHRPCHSSSTPRCMRNQGRCCVILGEGWAVAQGWFTDRRVYDLQP